jgi:hypothetical protein
LLPKKITQNNNLIKIIIAYSAKKINEKPPPPYSTLNPETKSDSPSAKSKGVRLVSAKQKINQTKDIGKEKKLTTNKLEKYKNKTNHNYKPK